MSTISEPGTSSSSNYLVFGELVSDGARVPEGVVATSGDRITYAGPSAELDQASFDAQGYEASNSPNDGALILPGLIDLHNHGGFGHDFPSGDEEGLRNTIDAMHRSGTTTLLASTVTGSREGLEKSFRILAKLAHEGLIAGIHAEGPFISPDRSGAQNPEFIVEPDQDFVAALVDAADGELVTMTYAPELNGAEALVETLTAHGITPSMGHTDSDAETAMDSLRRAREGLSGGGFDGYAGRPTVTHLFNGMPPMHHRSPGPVAASLRSAARGHAVVELIGDGVHLDPATVLIVFDLVGAPNIALVTDSMAAAGLADGEYSLGNLDVLVVDGAARLKSNGSLAGGTSLLIDVVRKTAEAGVALEDAVLSATAVPASVLGRADEIGSLHKGYRADLIVADPTIQVQKVMREGRWLKSMGA